MNLSEINWDLNEAGAWPKPIKIGAAALVFLIITGLGYYQFTSVKIAQLQVEQKGVTDALNKYQYAWRLAQNLELHQAQYKQIQSSLAEMMKLMPTKQARHATSRNSGTPVALIRSPTQRMGDALNALRP